MALKKRSDNVAQQMLDEAEAKTAEVVEDTAIAEEVEPVEANGLTQSENEVLSDNGEDVSVANSRKIDLAMELLAHQFNIDGTFYLTKAMDKGNKMTLGFSNMDYNVTVEIKNVEEMGLNESYE